MPKLALAFKNGTCFIIALEKCSKDNLDVTDCFFEGKNTIVFYSLIGFSTLINFVLKRACEVEVIIVN